MYYTFKFIYIEDVSSFKIHIYIVFKLRVNIRTIHLHKFMRIF